MGKFRLLERQVNDLIYSHMRSTGLLVLQRVRLHPCEMDIVLLDPGSLHLANIEIKRGNWKALLFQALRAKLFCHFSIAVLPRKVSLNVPTEEFSRHGIGLCFYEERNEELNLLTMTKPKRSETINRMLKMQVYRQFYNYYGETVYAGAG